MSNNLCWLDAPLYVDKTSWPDMCALVPENPTREEFEHALRMAFADDSKTSPAIKAKLCRAFAAVTALRESVPRIAPRVFEGLQSEIDASLALDAKTRKKPEFVRGVTCGSARPAPIVLGLFCWMRVSGSMDEEQLGSRGPKNSALSAPMNEQEENDDSDDDEEDEDGGAAKTATMRLTPQQRRLKHLLPPSAPKTVPQARVLLSRIAPLTFIPPFLFASSTNTIAGLLGTVTAVAGDATSGILATDPMSRCALICAAAPPDMVEAALVTELLTADVTGEKGFFRTPVACPSASEQPSPNQEEVFTVAHWFNTSDLAAPFTQPQVHHAYLVYGLRRAICRSATCPIAVANANAASGDGGGDNSSSKQHQQQQQLSIATMQQAFPPLSEPAAQRWRSYCDCLLRNVQSYASGVLGRNNGSGGSGQSCCPWVSSPTKGMGLRYWDALLREAVLLCEAASGAPVTRESETLSAALWMLLGQIQQGLRAALSLREYEPMLDIRSDAEGAAANSIAMVSMQSHQTALRPYLCHPEQLFVVCRAALRCDVVSASPARGGAARAAVGGGVKEKKLRARTFLRETCTEELLVSLALDPGAVPSTMTSIIRFAVEFRVAPMTEEVPHLLHALFSFASISPLVGGYVIADHMRSIYSALSATGRVELLLRILFMPLTCAALELQVSLPEAPDAEDVRADAGYCIFSLWRAIAPINAVSREQAATLPLSAIFSAAFSMAFDGNSEFKLMWECCMLDDLQMLGERERVASVCVKDSLIDAFFDCVAEDSNPPAEGILHAATFMFRFGVFPRMHCAAVLKRLVLHVRVLLGGFSSLDPSCHNQQQQQQVGDSVETSSLSGGSIAGASSSRSESSTAGNSTTTKYADPQAGMVASTRGDAMASTLLQFLCGFGASKVGVLHDDFDRYSDAFFDAVANVLVIVGKFASSSGEASATRVFQSLHDLAWDCLAAFANSTALPPPPSPPGDASGAAATASGRYPSMLSSGQSTDGSSAKGTSTTSGSKRASGIKGGKAHTAGANSSSCNFNNAVVQVSAASIESSSCSGSSLLAMQPTVGFVGLRVVGLKSLPSTHERMLRRLEAIAIALTNVTVRHPSLRERAVYWLRNAWKKTERWLQQQQDLQQHVQYMDANSSVKLQQMRERCEQLCITCSSLCNLLLNHNDVLIATNS